MPIYGQAGRGILGRGEALQDLINQERQTGAGVAAPVQAPSPVIQAPWYQDYVTMKRWEILKNWLHQMGTEQAPKGQSSQLWHRG